MKKQISFGILALFLINVAFAFDSNIQYKEINKESTQYPEKIIKIGENTIEFKEVKFVCESTKVPNPRQEADTMTPRQAPEGNYIVQSDCIRQSTSTAGTCAEYKRTVLKNEKNNPSCWIGTLKINNQEYKLTYGEEKAITPYFKVKYTTNAVYDIKGLNPDYNVYLNININTKEGLTTSLQAKDLVPSTDSTKITIKYNNNVLNNAGGGFEIKQKNILFFLTSTIDDKTQIFKSQDTAQFNLNNDVLGNKEISETPYIRIEEYTNGALSQSTNILGNEVMINSKTYVKRDLTGTEPYFKEESTNIITSFTNWINGLFA